MVKNSQLPGWARRPAVDISVTPPDRPPYIVANGPPDNGKSVLEATTTRPCEVLDYISEITAALSELADRANDEESAKLLRRVSRRTRDRIGQAESA